MNGGCILGDMKARRHVADPMEGLWLSFLFCAPLWTAVLILALR